MRIGMITAEIEPTNGWAQVSSSLIAALHEQGADLRITAAEGTRDVDAAILPRMARSETGVLSRLARALPQVRHTLHDCDVIHTMVEPFAPLGALIAGRRPHILTVHGTFAALPLMRRPPVGPLYRWAFERSTAACVSRYTQTVLRRSAPRVSSLVIPNGVDVARLIASAREAQPFPKYGPVVLFVGGVKARKGALQLIRAMAHVRDHSPDSICVVVGSLTAEPGTVAEVRAEIDRLNLADHVRLCGHISHDELMRWYRTADVFCVPSMNAGWRFEGFGLVYLEAGAFGLPAVGTRECGAADAIEENETGLLVSQADIDVELPQALLQLLNDPALRARLGAANKARAERMTWASVARQYLELYDAELRKARR